MEKISSPHPDWTMENVKHIQAIAYSTICLSTTIILFQVDCPIIFSVYPERQKGTHRHTEGVLT